jgi:hypothetical protein
MAKQLGLITLNQNKNEQPINYIETSVLNVYQFIKNFNIFLKSNKYIKFRISYEITYNIYQYAIRIQCSTKIKIYARL